jgi:hypothetical protein
LPCLIISKLESALLVAERVRLGKADVGRKADATWHIAMAQRVAKDLVNERIFTSEARADTRGRFFHGL